MAGLLAVALLALIAGLALRFEPLVYLFYALVGVYLANRFWLGRSLRALRGGRVIGRDRERGDSDTSAFLGDRVEVTLPLRNDGLLPLAWAVVEEHLPPGLRSVGEARWALSLAPRERRTLHYQLFCGHRGYYPIGPLVASGGTPWEAERSPRTLAPVSYFTVYPHIVPLEQLGLPSRLPLGARRSRNLLLPDPSRLVGVREYQAGDRLRDIHWRASARLGVLQVKKFEPSRPLQVALFLDLDEAAYDFRTRERASELAIVVAASLAAHVIEQRQAVGLVTNGRDPLAEARAVDLTAPPPPPDGLGSVPRSGAAAPGESEPAGGAAPDATAAVAPRHAPLVLTDRLTAAPAPATPARRRVMITDPYSPLSLPEETYDEEASVYIDGPLTTRPPAAPVVVPVHDGQAHLAIVLTVLARIALRETPEDGRRIDPAAAPPLPFTRMVRRRAAGLPWGTTLVFITAAPTEELLPTMLHLRRAGFSPLAIFVQPPRLATDLDAATVRAAGLPAYEVYDEAMLNQLQLAVTG
jgi:uncharacterized protein (DUF58 family)